MSGPPPNTALLQLQGEILEDVAHGTALPAIGDHVCRVAEAMAGDALCSILTVDAEGRLHPLSAPSLPAVLASATDNLQSGPMVGSCGAAAWSGEPVETLDIATDPRWEAFATLALGLGLRACWSCPIKTMDGRVIGTFAFYYREPRGPTALERDIVEHCVHVCAIALAHHEAQERIFELAYYDTLTGLPNRIQFQQMVERELADMPHGATMHLHSVDLDDFKAVNDAFGHRAGDQLLIEVARRLKHVAQRSGARVARLGGDEFALVQICYGEGDQGLSNRLIAAIDSPIELEDASIDIGASIGVAGGDASASLADLSRRADLALYAAKREGGRKCIHYSPAMEDYARLRNSLKQHLRRALDNGDFHLVYQPIVDLGRGELIGVEALLRWNHPEHGEVPPDVFIPIAEEAGLIGVIGGWVLGEATRAAASWPQPIKLGVNLSPLQLRRPGIVRKVIDVLRDSGLPPQRLDLEITETALLERDGATRQALCHLHEQGVRLSLDDFGTGYSSLQLLRMFPFDRIKIDMSFVRDIDIDAGSMAIIDAVIRLADELGMRSTAEGVETARQWDWLISHGCIEGQGYWFSKALDEAGLRKMFERCRGGEPVLLPIAAHAAAMAADQSGQDRGLRSAR